MEETPYKIEILDAIRKLAQELNRPPTRNEFRERSGISEYRLLKHFSSFREALSVSGLEASSNNVKLDDEAMLTDWGYIAREIHQAPTRYQYNRKGKYSSATFCNHFIRWAAIPEKFRRFAEGKPEWADVLDILPPVDAKRVSKSDSSRGVSSFSEPIKTSDNPPDFAKLKIDSRLQDILRDRWLECLKCIGANAPLATTVMMGGLLEALFLARVNHEKDKSLVYKANAAPKEKDGKTSELDKWGLSNFIDVAHELGWISQSAKDVGAVLRDYRNYVHPYKEFKHRVRLNANDVPLLWDVAKNIAIQILNSA